FGREEFEGDVDVPRKRGEQRRIVCRARFLCGIEGGIHGRAVFPVVAAGGEIHASSCRLAVHIFTVSGTPGNARGVRPANPASLSSASICSSEKPRRAWA